MKNSRWISDVTFENVATADNRFILADALRWRELPLSLMAMHVNSGDGHTGSYVAGRIDSFSKDAMLDMNGQPLTNGAIALRGGGVFDMTGPDGNNIARLVDDEMLRGISVDLAAEEIGLRDPETGEVIGLREIGWEEVERYMMGELQMAFLRATVIAATVVPTPAFDDARIALLAGAEGGKILRTAGTFKLVEAEPLVASSSFVIPPPGQGWVNADYVWTGNTTATTNLTLDDALVADAAPLRPPRDWFETQELPGPTPLTITDEGRVFGHIAVWDSCHVAFGDACVKPPRSHSDYAYFHVGELETDDGAKLAVGKLMFKGPHASVTASRTGASKHYDSNTHVAGYLRASDGRYGIWVCGALRHGLSSADIAEVRANPPSGDWRPVNGRHELICALAVPVPGFPTPRAETAVVASGDEFEVLGLIVSSGPIALTTPVHRALVAAGFLDEPMPSRLNKAEQISVLTAAAAENPIEALAALALEEH